MTLGPEDVRAHYARKAAADKAPPPDNQDIIDAILKNISPNYFRLRLGLAVGGFALPVLLFVFAGFRFDYSISTYYHSGEVPRNILIGILWAVGAFLILYQGYSRVEDRLLNLAGLAAIATSLCPTGNESWNHPGTVVQPWVGTTHLVASIILFVCLAIICVFLSGRTLSLIQNDKVRRRYWLRYYLFGGAMIFIPATIAASTRLFALDSHKLPIVWGLEVTVIYVFALFWRTKSNEFKHIAEQFELL